jgi:superfamily II DNA or RNA helicase
MPTGTGKSLIFGALKSYLGLKGKILILAHRKELLDQAQAHMQAHNPEAKISLDKAAIYSDLDSDIIVGSVQTLGLSTNDRLERIDPNLYDALIIDECFVAGTIIDETPIEQIKKGDYVTSYNEKTKKIELRKVLEFFKHKPNRLLTIKTKYRSITCTPNHPIYTSYGWKKAEEITTKDYILYNLWYPLQAKIQRLDEEDLFGKLLQKEPFSDDDQNQQEVCISQNEEKQSNEKSCIQKENDKQIKRTTNGWRKSKTGWKWAWTYSHRKIIAIKNWWRSVYYSNQFQALSRKTLSKPLQNRLSLSRNQTSNRDRWTVTQSLRKKATRLKERSLLVWNSVECIEIHKPTSDGTFGGMCPDGYVYNLEIEGTHTYHANSIVVHNCHHSVTDSYEKIIRHFGLSKRLEEINPNYTTSNGKKLLLGLTATPNRSDNVGLISVFDNIVYDYSIKEAITDGWLVDVKGTKITTKVGLDLVSSRAGDFATNELSHAVNIKERNKLVVHSWLKHAQQRQTVIFCVDINHAQELANEFRLAGVMTEAIWDSDPNRSQKLRLHKEKVLQVITNVGILTEGYNDPSVSCILMARPTKSSLLYCQMVGRGLRLEEDTGNLHEAIKNNLSVKKDCLIIDIVDNTSKHSLVTLASLFGLPPLLDLKEKSVLDTIKTVDEFKYKNPTADLTHLQNIDSIQHYAVPINLLKPASDVDKFSKLTWYKMDANTHLVVLPNNQWCKISKNLLNTYDITGYINDTLALKESTESQQEAFAYAETWINCYLERWKINLVKRNAKWKRDPITQSQIDFIKKIMGKKCPPDISFYTKGDASNLINGLKAKKYV